jgi:hypothetical protein
VAIVDTAANFNVSKRDLQADSVIMHPSRNAIAVRAAQGENATTVQVSDP